MNTLVLIAFAVILWRVVMYCADLPDEFLKGHKIRAFGMAVSFAMIAVASLGILLDMPGSGKFMLVSMALLIISDRRWRIAP